LSTNQLIALLLACIRAKVLAVYTFSRSAPIPGFFRKFPIEVSHQVFQALVVVWALSGEYT
jgi:hypothetical protein